MGEHTEHRRRKRGVKNAVQRLGAWFHRAYSGAGTDLRTQLCVAGIVCLISLVVGLGVNLADFMATSERDFAELARSLEDSLKKQAARAEQVSAVIAPRVESTENVIVVGDPVGLSAGDEFFIFKRAESKDPREVRHYRVTSEVTLHLIEGSRFWESRWNALVPEHRGAAPLLSLMRAPLEPGQVESPVMWVLQRPSPSGYTVVMVSPFTEQVSLAERIAEYERAHLSSVTFMMLNGQIVAGDSAHFEESLVQSAQTIPILIGSTTLRLTAFPPRVLASLWLSIIRCKGVILLLLIAASSLAYMFGVTFRRNSMLKWQVDEISAQRFLMTEHLRVISEGHLGGVFVVNRYGTFLHGNSWLLERIPQLASAGRHIWEVVVTPEERPRVRSLAEGVLHGEPKVEFDTTLHVTGAHTPVRIRLVPVLSGERSVMGFAGFVYEPPAVVLDEVPPEITESLPCNEVKEREVPPQVEREFDESDVVVSSLLQLGEAVARIELEARETRDALHQLKDAQVPPAPRVPQKYSEGRHSEGRHSEGRHSEGRISSTAGSEPQTESVIPKVQRPGRKKGKRRLKLNRRGTHHEPDNFGNYARLLDHCMNLFHNTVVLTQDMRQQQMQLTTVVDQLKESAEGVKSFRSSRETEVTVLEEQEVQPARRASRRKKETRSAESEKEG